MLSLITSVLKFIAYNRSRYLLWVIPTLKKKKIVISVGNDKNVLYFSLLFRTKWNSIKLLSIQKIIIKP